MDEKIIELPKALEILQQQINAVYPFQHLFGLKQKIATKQLCNDNY